MRRAALAGVAALVLAGSAGAVPGGLRGRVDRGPVQPVCREGMPCTAPAIHVKLVFVRAGASHAVSTDAHGRYAIQLDPGTWAVRIPSARFGYRPRAALVVGGRVRVENFTVDTGIR
jgi:hypothetical protein